MTIHQRQFSPWRLILTGWAAAVMCIAAQAEATVFRVEQDGSGAYSEIQPAVDAAASGDTILVGPGNYNQTHTIWVEPWGAETEVVVDLSGKDLTLLGVDRDQVLIGPDVYVPSYFGPNGIFRIDRTGPWRVENVTTKNCYDGVYGSGSFEIINCRFRNHEGAGIFVSSDATGAIEDCEFTDNEDGIATAGIDQLLVADSTFLNSYNYLSGSRGILVEGCTFDLSDFVFYGSDGEMRNCTGVRTQVHVAAGAVTRLSRCEFSKVNYASLAVVSGAEAEVDSSIFESGIYPVAVHGYGKLTMHNSHILSFGDPGSLLVQCTYYDTGWTVIDMTNNYWGTDDPAEVAARIWDNNDDPDLKVVVEFEPIAESPTPTETSSWGGVKAMFR